MINKVLVSRKSRKLSFSIWIGLLALCLLISVAACKKAAPLKNGGLTLEEYSLTGPPDLDNGIFQPIGVSQDVVLAKHQAERERIVSNKVSHTPENFYPLMESRGPGQDLAAAIGTSPGEPFRQTIELLQGDQILFKADAGMPSPVMPLQSLWTYEDHWVLEILYAEEEVWEGRIFRDGLLLNDILDYQEAFGFQLLAGKPFYFLMRENKLGYSFDEVETGLPYDKIFHYGCCSSGYLNPLPAENMVAFFALTGDDWFYVELGDFSQD